LTVNKEKLFFLSLKHIKASERPQSARKGRKQAKLEFQKASPEALNINIRVSVSSVVKG
jgi:hypothetical protein